MYLFTTIFNPDATAGDILQELFHVEPGQNLLTKVQKFYRFMVEVCGGTPSCEH